MPKNILIIEDEHFIRMNLAELLEENEYRVFTAATGREGIKLAKELLPDLIISDIMLPDKDGYEVLSELNSTDNLSVIPFVFLTAKADIQDLRKGMLLGAADYITKPYDAAELIRVVELRLRKSEELKKHYKNNSQPSSPRKLNENDKILVMVNGKPSFIKLSQIIYISSDNVYTTICLKDDKPALVRKTMKQWEEILPEEMFLRIHRSTIINSDYILRIERWFNRTYKIFMNDTTQTFIVSQRYAQKLKNKII